LKKLFANIFQFNRGERLGVIALVVILIILIGVNQFLYLIITEKQLDYSQYEHLVVPEEKVKNYPTEKTNDATAIANKPHIEDAPAAYPAKKQQAIIELNTADSLTLLSLNGIGPTFAGRIIKYRKLLGGFVKKDQLAEVYGFKDNYEQVKDFVTANGNVTKINLNTCTFKELNKHPYIEYELTKAIFNLKKKLGKFSSVDEIKQIDLVNAELYNKLAPYLTTQ